MNKRDFTKLAAISTVGALARPTTLMGNPASAGKSKPLSINVFSKHLQFLGYKDLARAAREIGFDGVDLTVRPKGHVEPENVERDLPKAVDAVRGEGLKAVMMTSSVRDADDPLHVQVLKTASKEGIRYYRTAYFNLNDVKTGSWKQTLDLIKIRFDALGELNKKYGLHGAYQNHSGTRIGSYLPDIAYLLEGSNPRWLGCQYDVRHATVEGGTAWPLGLQWVRNYIRTIDIKDFKWGEKNGKPSPTNVPIGEGVVDFKRFFQLLRQYEIQPEVSMHFEYDMGGAERGKREITWSRDQVCEAMRSDLQRVHKLWEESASA